MNKRKLRSVMLLHGDTNKSLAEYLDISEKSLSDKINESGTEFKQSEIMGIKTKYSLSDNDVIDIFFTS